MSDAEPSGSSPYRDGAPLADIIPPDRRRQRTLLIVGASMIVGACLVEAVRLLQGAAASSPTATPAADLGHLRPVVLHGPDGERRLPGSSMTVVHVWLQGCADCMSAFDAIQKIEDEGGLRVPAPVVNVAYGEADVAWAARYHVRDGLVFDPGGSLVVNPLGIRSFTTLVVDGNGRVLLRDRPDRPGYLDRLHALLGMTDPSRPPRPPTDPSGGTLSAEDVEGVVMTHRQDVRRRCWEQGTKLESARVSASVVVSARGEVLEVSASGDPDIATCVEREVRTWRFPARGTTSATVVVPFQFSRQ